MTDELETRLRALEDRSALWELVSRYAMAVDDEDYEALRGLFAKDATFHGLQGEPAEGRDAIVAYLNHRAATAHRSRVHTPTSQVLDGVGSDSVEGTVACYAALFGTDDSKTFFAFRYADRYVREDGRWQFASRRVHDLTHIIND
jgi:uncharacterized protein (TIGR02246 family)